MKHLFIILLSLYLLSCKKENNAKVTSPSSPTGTSSTDTYEVLINSNYLRTQMSVENMSENIVMKRYNTAVDSTRICPINYTFTGVSSKKYRVYTVSVKNSTDTTKDMSDNGLTWNYLRVKKNGVIIYEKKDSVGYGNGYGSNRITSNDLYINY